MALHTENYISLYSGGGGLDLGFRLANPDARPVLYVEREFQAAALLVDHIEAGLLEPAPVWSDTGTLDCAPFVDRVDWIIGGPPCQPFSDAGLQLGAGDPRNQWPTALRVVSNIAPEFCFFENVASADLIWYIYEEVEPCLRALGYEVEIGIFSASEIGAPHTRRRIFIMAHSGHDARCSELGKQHSIETGGIGESSEGMALPNSEPGNLRQRSERYEFARGGRPFPPGRDEYDEWAIYLAERPDLSPASQPGFRRGIHGVARPMDGLSRSTRLRILGNGVVPQQAALAFRELSKRTSREKVQQTI